MTHKVYWDNWWSWIFSIINNPSNKK
jgi:hypothetical protein